MNPLAAWGADPAAADNSVALQAFLDAHAGESGRPIPYRADGSACYSFASPLLLRKAGHAHCSAILDMGGIEFAYTGTSGVGLTIGTASEEAIYLAVRDLVVSTQNQGPTAAVHIVRCDHSVFRDCQFVSSGWGADYALLLDGPSLYGIRFDSCEVGGGKIANVRAHLVNHARWSGGKCQQGQGVGIELDTCGRFDVDGVDLSFVEGDQVSLRKVGGSVLSGLYIEKPGPAAPGNDVALVRLVESRGVLIQGCQLNAANGTATSSNHAAWGVHATVGSHATVDTCQHQWAMRGDVYEDATSFVEVRNPSISGHSGWVTPLRVESERPSAGLSVPVGTSPLDWEYLGGAAYVNGAVELPNPGVSAVEFDVPHDGGPLVLSVELALDRYLAQESEQTTRVGAVRVFLVGTSVAPILRLGGAPSAVLLDGGDMPSGDVRVRLECRAGQEPIAVRVLRVGKR